MLRTRVRSWPGPPSSFHPTFSESEGHSAWFDKVKLTIAQDSTLTTSGTTLRETLDGLSRSTTNDPECDSASSSTYEDALTHISDETLPRISIGSIGPPKTEQSDVRDGDISTNNSGPSDNCASTQTPPPTPAPVPIRPAPEPRMIPARQQLTALERMKSLNIRSSIQLTADESVRFNLEDERILDQFVFVLSTDWIRILRDLRLPMFIPCLVSVTDLSSPPKPLGTYICIKGLLREEHIRSFHSVVSQRAVRRHYAPLKICYDTRLIRYAASEDGPEAMNSPVRNPETLCGRVLRTKRMDGSEYLTTVGGLIRFGDSCYIMTSSDHREDPRDLDSHETASVSSQSSGTDSDDGWCSIASTVEFSEDNFDDNIEGPVLCAHGRIEVELKARDRGPTAKNLHPGSDIRNVQDVLQLDTPGILGSDKGNSHWQLIPAPNDLVAHNYISVPAGVFGAAVNTGYIRGHLSCGDIKPGTAVAINAGVSGISGGTIVGRPSYLFSNGKLQQVWTIKMRPGTDLQRGDSGSWVLDSSLNVLGSVLAISDGTAYMVSLEQQLQQINDTLKLAQVVHGDNLIKAEVASDSSILRGRPIDRIDPHGTVAREDTSPAAGRSTRHTSSQKHHLSPLVLEESPASSPNLTAQRPEGVNRGKGWTFSKPDPQGETWDSSPSLEDLAEIMATANTEGPYIPPEPSGSGLLGSFTIMCLILNRTIGSGIFTHPTNVLNSAGGPALALILWVVAGFITWASVVCWTEFGISIPRYPIQTQDYKYGARRRILTPISGGESTYINRIFPLSLFTKPMISMLGLSSFLIHITAMSSNGLQFGLQMESIALSYNYKPRFPFFGEVDITSWAFLALASCCVLNILSRRVGIWLNNAFAIAKVMILVAIIWTGYYMGERYRLAHRTSFKAPTDETPSTSPSFQSILSGLSFAIYAYGGFEEAVIAVADVQPRSRVARPAFAAIGIVIFLFPLVNMAFYGMVPPELYADSVDVVSIFFERALGGVFEDPSAAKSALACVLALSSFGNILTMTWTAFSMKVHRAPSSHERFGILPCDRSFCFLGPLHVQKWGERSKEVGWRRTDSTPFFDRINYRRSHQWGTVLVVGLVLLTLTTANLFLGSAPSSMYEFLCLVTAYTSTIIPGAILVVCLLCMKFVKLKSHLIPPLTAIFRLLADPVSEVAQFIDLSISRWRNAPVPNTKEVKVFRWMNDPEFCQPESVLDRIWRYYWRLEFPSLLAASALIAYCLTLSSPARMVVPMDQVVANPSGKLPSLDEAPGGNLSAAAIGGIVGGVVTTLLVVATWVYLSWRDLVRKEPQPGVWSTRSREHSEPAFSPAKHIPEWRSFVSE